MTQVQRDSGTVNARIVYWGIEGSGKSTNLRAIHAKLRPDHRGELQTHATRLDPTVTYEVLPIELGDVSGVRTRIEVMAVPGAPEQAPTRKQLLDRVDGIVFVVDADPARIDENLASFDELRRALSAYGRSLEQVPLVVQYNKCDRSGPYALEELHRKLDLRGAAAFEAVASEGTAVLPTLTTISKRVMRVLRDHGPGLAPAATAPPPPAAVPPPAAAAPPAAEAVPLATPLRPAPARPAPAAPPGPRRAATPLPPPEPFELEPPAPFPAPAAPAPSLEDAIAAEAAHPQSARIAETAAVTRAALEGLDRTEVVTSEAPGALTLESAGQARVLGPRTLRLPLVLRDAEGRRQTLSLTLELRPDEDEA
jgi:signal recognition particle receptor subunit beta